MAHTQASLLEEQTLDELFDLTFRVGPLMEGERMPGRKKAAAGLVMRLMDETPDLPLLLLGWERAEALAAAMPVKGPRGEENEHLVAFRDEFRSEALSRGLALLRMLGLAWRDRHSWHVLPKARTMLRNRKTLRVLMEIADVAEGLFLETVNLYGAAPMETVENAVRTLMKAYAPADGENVPQDILDLVMDLGPRRCGPDTLYFPDGEEGGVWFCSPWCLNPHDLWEANRDAADWYVPREDELTWTQDSIPMDKARAGAFLDEAAAALADRGCTAKEAAASMRRSLGLAFSLLQEGSTDEAEELLLSLSEDDAGGRRQISLVRQTLSSFPRWKDRGWSPAARSRHVMERKAPVGRNDPCPCGSGKKYKNCHGRLN